MTTTLSAVSETSPDRLKTPRLVSLEHRLRHAKDPKGRPIPLYDEVLFFLDDPPADTADRWQAGADMCAEHGIKTSRMAVWRFYRNNILQWRRDQNPAPEPDPQEIARLHEQARLLAARRVIEMLNDPSLTPEQLTGLLRHETQRRNNELARDQFDDRIKMRHQQKVWDDRKRIEEEARRKAHNQFLFEAYGIPNPDALSFSPIPAHTAA